MREAFLPFFFKKKIKSEARAQKGWQTLHVLFFLLLVAQLVLRTDAIPSSRVFIRHALNNTWYNLRREQKREGVHMIPLVIKVLGTTNSLALQELDTVDRVYSCVCNAPICNPSTIPLAKISTILSANTNDHADPPIQFNHRNLFLTQCSISHAMFSSAYFCALCRLYQVLFQHNHFCTSFLFG